MFEKLFVKWRSNLSPQGSLDLATVFLKEATSQSDNPEVALAFCNQAEYWLDHVRKASKKTNVEIAQVLQRNVVMAYLEHARIVILFSRPDKALSSFKKIEKWGGLPAIDPTAPDTADPVALDMMMPVTVDILQQPPVLNVIEPVVLNVTEPASASKTTSESAAASATQGKGKGSKVAKAVRDLAEFPAEIFTNNVAPPNFSCTLPEVSKQLVDTPQLAYCLTVLTEDNIIDPVTQKWRATSANDADELIRLETLVRNVVRAFERDELKDADAIAEVTYLAPFLGRPDFRFLLGHFVDGLEHSVLLNIHSLEGIAQLMQSAALNSLCADDLVRTLGCINKRMRLIHGPDKDYIHRVTTTVSRVLDAMADSHIMDLKHQDLHEPLSAYLEKLMISEDPYTVFQAAYAFQALQCVPDDESLWQAAQRRGTRVAEGAFKIVSAAKALDVNGFIDGLCSLQASLEGVVQVVKIAKNTYDKVSELMASGQELKSALQDGLSFDRKRTWYTALRGLDTLLQNGQLAEFKSVVCQAPCRRALEFQWGLCLRLGNVAIDPLWDEGSREDAIDFLGQLYADDKNWGHHVPVKKLILDILMQLVKSGEIMVQVADALLEMLKDDGDEEKRKMYKACREPGPSAHPLMAVKTPPAVSPLLDRVQGKTDLERDLKRLRLARNKLRGTTVYISPRAKSSLQALDADHFDLMETALDFLDCEEQKVLLVLGESGVGKSTFNLQLESELWSVYIKKIGRIPLFINLPSIIRPELDLIAKHLRQSGFEESQIRELKDRKFVLICDGYDESQQTHNLYTSNRLNQEGEWRAQMVISCRSDYVGMDYKDSFQPSDRNEPAVPGELQEAVIIPFDPDQINEYIEKYVGLKKPLWSTDTYINVLKQTPSLQELVKNPFLLTLSLDVLPRMVSPNEKTFSTAKVTRVTLYDQFVQQWLERSKKRLVDKDLNGPEKKAFESLSDEGFVRNGIGFLKRLAAEVFEKQGGYPVIEYSRVEDEGSWKDKFFGREDERQILRDACPLIRSGNQYRFIHRSILEYGLARAVFEPRNGGICVTKALEPSAASKRRGSTSSAYSFEMESALEDFSSSPVQDLKDKSPLFGRSFVGEPSILQFLEERVQQEPVFEEQLREYIELSKGDKKWRTAAANAITILVRAGFQFNGAQFNGIQIPGADLSHGVFDSAQLQEADMRKVQLRNVWLRQAELTQANMERAHFGEWPLLQEDSVVLICRYCPKGETCAVGLLNGMIHLYDTYNWERIHQPLDGHNDSVLSLVFSPKGDKIASGSWDATVRLWETRTGKLRHVFEGHTNKVNSVAYSPTGKQIASCSDDKTVMLWDTQTGLCLHILDGHTDKVVGVAYSHKGDQIVSGSWDNTLQLWDTRTGQLRHVFNGHTDKVKTLAFSPTGEQIASGSYDHTVRLWDTQAGQLLHTLRDHKAVVQSVVYSPSGNQIASGGNDKIVRLWDTQTGLVRCTLKGHSQTVFRLAFSPTGEQIASSSSDRAVRLWDSQTGQLHHTLDGHADVVTDLSYSPNGVQIASGSKDKTVRLWDARYGPSRQIRDGHKGAVYSVAYSSDAKQIASGGMDRTVRLWDAKTGQLCFSLDGHGGWVYTVVYSPTSEQIASSSHDKTVRLWDASTGQLQHTLGSGTEQILDSHTDPVLIVAYSPNGKQIASGSSDKTVRLWDPRTGQALRTLVGHTSKVRSVAFSPSGELIASGSWDCSVWLWDARTGDTLHKLVGHTDKVYGVMFSSTGEHIASRSHDKTVRQWNVKDGTLCHALEGHTDKVESIAYSPNGEQIASGSDDNTVRLWDSKTGHLLHTCEGHTDNVESIAYSLHGKHVISSSKDKTVRLWDTVSGECLTVIHGFNGVVYSIAMKESKNGYSLVTGCDDKSVRMWEVRDKDDHCHVHLTWTSGNTTLTMSGATINNVKGLNRVNRTLLQQRGSVGIPTSQFHEAGRIATIVTSAVSNFKMLRKPIPHGGTTLLPIECVDSSSTSPMLPTHD